MIEFVTSHADSQITGPAFNPITLHVQQQVNLVPHMLPEMTPKSSSSSPLLQETETSLTFRNLVALGDEMT